MSIEKPEKGKMKIVHTREGLSNPKNKSEDLGGPIIMDLNFIKNIVFNDSVANKQKEFLIKLYENEVDLEKKESHWKDLIEFVKEYQGQ